MKHAKTQEERKELDRRSRARRAERVERRPRKKGRWVGAEIDEDEAAWALDEDQSEFESMPRAPKFRGDAARVRELRREVLGARPGAKPGDEVAATDVPTTGPTFTVLSCAPGRALVRGSGVEREAVLAAEIAREQRTRLAVGDEVELEEREGAAPRIVCVRPRRSRISRPDPSRPDVERVLAANVDVAVIVVALRRPALRIRLIDRYLVASQFGGVEPVVCANKADLLESAADRARFERELEPYGSIGVPTLFTSAASGEGIEELRERIHGRTVVFLGQSGVGKSSLLNALAPELALETGDVRQGDGKGRHTTTRSSLRDLGGGTRWIDTPGIRGFLLTGVTPSTLESYFPEFQRESDGCRFRDCLHETEPACAVRDAVEGGRIPGTRYQTYRRILASLRE